MSKVKSQKSKVKTGFTIIELLVAMTLFLVLMGIVTGGFIRSLRTQRAIVALMEVNDNVSLSLEQMAREIRTGYNFSKVSDSELQFTNAYGIPVFYRLYQGTIERGTEEQPLQKIYKKITADTVMIKNFHIELLGNNPGDGYPPRITISLSATSANPGIQKMNIFTSIQTTISARVLDT